MTENPPRIVLLQARRSDDPMLGHELDCFIEHTELPAEAFRTVNLAEDSLEDTNAIIADIDAVMVGGSGDYSCVLGGFDWHQPMLELLKEIVARDVPTFASCFGFQALAQGFGGTLVRDPDMAEVGSFDVTLAPAASEDRVFAHMPETFTTQLGHKDTVTVLPEDFVHLAGSARCAHQAIRIRGTRVVATQFHPELSRQANYERFEAYAYQYMGEGNTLNEALREAKNTFRESEESSSLLRRFLATEL